MNQREVASLLDGAEKDIDKWHERVHQVNTKNSTALNAYLAIYDNDAARGSHGSACYGGVGGYMSQNTKLILNWVATGNAMETWDCSHGDDLYRFTRKELISYFSYLARKSPWSQAFADKHAGNMVDRGYAIMRPDLPGNLVVGAMTAHRQAWEYTRVVRAWLLLRKLQPKVNPDFHFLVAHSIKLRTAPGRSPEFLINPLGTGHTPLDMRYMSIDDCKNFIAHKPEAARKSLFTEDKTYSGITELFGHGYGKKFITEFTKEMEAGRKKHGVDLKSTLFAWNLRFNLFKKEDLESFSLREMLPVIEAFYNKHFGGET